MSSEITAPEGIQDLARLACHAAEIHDANQAALAAERCAETDLLAAIVTAVRPALGALSKRPSLGHLVRWHNGYSTLTDRPASWTGVWVCGDEGPTEDHPRDSRGSYEGSALYLRRDGAFIEVTYRGHWSRWQGEGSDCEGTCDELSPADVARRWRVEDIAACLRDALDRATGDRARDPARLSIQRAERFRALASLLGA